MQIYALFLITQHQKGDFSPFFSRGILAAAQLPETGRVALKILTLMGRRYGRAPADFADLADEMKIFFS